MNVWSRNMPTPATYWPPASEDRFGSDGYGAPVPIKVRWQAVAVLFRDPQGRETTSRAVVYCSHAVEERGLLAMTHDADISSGREIRAVMTSPSLGGDHTLVKAML